MRRRNKTTRPNPERQHLAWLLVAFSLSAATGCATSGTLRPAAAAPSVPQAWSRSAGGAMAAREDLSRWWERLGDPTLSGLVQRALDTSPDVRTARSRLRQARAQRDLAQASLRPSVSASGSASTSKRSDAEATGTFAAGIDASWEPDVFGGLQNSLRAARADLAASVEDVHAVQVSLAAEVGVNYVDLRGSQARLEIAKANLASQSETLQLTEWRAQAGLVSQVDVEQARANLAQTRAQVPALQTAIAEAQHRLAVLVGLDPTALTARLDTAAAIPAPADHVAVGIPAESLRQRPDVRAAEQRVVAETARLAQKNAARYPSFTLRGSLGTDIVTGALTGGTSMVASLAASLVQTIFDAGRIRSQIEVQGAAQEQAVIAYESTVLTALEEVENALVALEKNRERLEALTVAAQSARNAAQLARQQYAAGLADFQTVLDTERNVLSAEDSVASTQVNRTTALIQLYKALGGGWSQSGQTAASLNASGRP